MVSELIITILDGYTDEPSCLGVPPFVAPLPRYIYGAIKNVNPAYRINYLTIDEYRSGMARIRSESRSRTGKKSNNEKLVHLFRSKLLIIIAGAIVPGKYLRAMPISLREILTIAEQFNGLLFLGGAAARLGFMSGRSNYNKQLQLKDVFDLICIKDLDAAVFDQLSGNEPADRYRTLTECKTWSKDGSELLTQHPDFPGSLVVEVEGGRGCVRYFTGGCNFCAEPHFGEPVFRPPEDIIAEVEHLSGVGARHFRLGALSCIFSYFAKGIGESETPKPNPDQVSRLLRGIRNAAPNLETLHLDNANPAVMAAHIEETRSILKVILQTCTGGNVLSFGLESADPKVISANNLNTHPQEVEDMVKLVNRYGSGISNTGMPILLPGLNLVYGLQGESKLTYQLNYEFLRSLFDQGLLLRRINMRQVFASVPGPNTAAGGVPLPYTKKHHREFVDHKKQVRDTIDRPMLERILPPGTVLKDVYAEINKGNLTFARQLGTYPILVGIPYKVTLNEFFNVVITEYGFRSVTGFTTPFKINNATECALRALPGIGTKRAVRLLRARPFRTHQEVYRALADDQILPSTLTNTKRMFDKHLSFL